MPSYLSLILLVVFFVAGFLEARRFETQYGRTPWGWSPALWGAVLGLVWPIGLVLLAIAERSGRADAKKRASAPTLTQPAPFAGGNVLPRF